MIANPQSLPARSLPGLIAAAFAAALVVLTVAATTGSTFDLVFGGVTLIEMTLPVSLLIFAAAPLLEAVPSTSATFAQAVLLAPGLLEVALLWWVLRRGRRSAAWANGGTGFALATASLVVWGGVTFALREQSGGVPLIVLGGGQAVLAVAYFLVFFRGARRPAQD
ncbi:hypothetical protein MF672_026300 [Actinomadura sp. ATCC 31491]|uniref:Uncharacterized protein n=1 Tax=Actinomadura luzonensis TaxID=2805427 RepID=A0ABT0FZF9_9ACTN|nr:hypothetical protein [Actinomadura luzonensis]MCK2217273.1 hypothetical protein [Actinomadura luzonensis]